MAINRGGFATAIESLSSAIVLGESWRPSLEQMCASVDAKTAALSRTSPTQLHIVATQALDEPLADLRAGRTPAYSPEIIMTSSPDDGFISDTAPRFRERPCRVPFFRDYMRPVLDIPHRGTAALEGGNLLSTLRLSFWRGTRQGMFLRDELSQLDAFLPALRIATKFSQSILRQKAHEHSFVYRNRGDFVFHLDFLGRPVHEDHAGILAQGDPLKLCCGRLISACAAEQRGLDAMIARALPGLHEHGAISLTRLIDGRRFFLLAMPIVGVASEVFGPVSVLCVLIDPSKRANPKQTAIQSLSKAVGLTGREAEIVSLVSIGLSPIDVARKLVARVIGTYASDRRRRQPRI